MARHDGGAPDEVDLLFELDAERGRLARAGADRRAIDVGVDDGVAEDMHTEATALIEGAPQAVEGDPLRLHQGEQFLHVQLRRLGLDEARRGEDDIAGREDHLAAVAVQDIDLFLSLRVHGFAGVLVALGKVVRLKKCEVFEWRGLLVDDDVVHQLECREVHRAQVLRHERTVVRLADVGVRRQARDEDISLALREHQVTQVTRVHQIERAVTHDDLLLARPRPDERAQLVARLDLATVAVVRRPLGLDHRPSPEIGRKTRAWRRNRFSFCFDALTARCHISFTGRSICFLVTLGRSALRQACAAFCIRCGATRATRRPRRRSLRTTVRYASWRRRQSLIARYIKTSVGAYRP